jgi:hypothetical protein
MEARLGTAHDEEEEEDGEQKERKRAPHASDDT